MRTWMSFTVMSLGLAGAAQGCATTSTQAGGSAPERAPDARFLDRNDDVPMVMEAFAATRARLAQSKARIKALDARLNPAK